MKKFLILMAGVLLFGDNFIYASSKIIRQSVTINVGTARVINLPFAPGEVLKGDLGATDIDPETGEAGDLQPSDTVFEAKWKGNRVRIRGLQRGSGNLEIFDKKGNKRMIISVYISTPQKGRTVKTLQDLLKNVEGVRVYISGDNVTIDGELFRQKDRERINEIVRQHSDDNIKIMDLTTYSPIYMQAMAQKIQREINDPHIEVRALKDNFIVRGVIEYTTKGNEKEDLEERQKALEKAGNYYTIANAYMGEKNYTGLKEGEKGSEQRTVEAIKIVAKSDTQKIEKQIRIQLDFVELAKSYAKKFGFKWAPGIYSGEADSDQRARQGLLGDVSSAQVTRGGITATITGTISNLFPKLHNAKQFGHARVLETAQVITKNKTTAQFNSTRGILLKAINDEGKASYQTYEFGLKSNYTPEIIDETSSVNLRIEIDYESIPEGAITPGSTFPKHRIHSELIVNSGESAAIGGMIKSASAKMFDRIPHGLENSFINIYHSKDFVDDKSQMIMFITPFIVEDASSGGDKLKRKFRVK